MSTKAALSPQLFKDPECWTGRDLNPRPPARQTGAYPNELTGRRYKVYTFLCPLNYKFGNKCIRKVNPEIYLSMIDINVYLVK